MRIAKAKPQFITGAWACSGVGWIAVLFLLGLLPLIGSAEEVSQSSALHVFEDAAGGVRLEWTRATGPPHLLGWHVERQRVDGHPLRLTTRGVKVDLFDSPSAIYHFHDDSITAHAGDVVVYRLVAIDPELREWPSAFVEQRVEPAAVKGTAERGLEPSRLTSVTVTKDASPPTIGEWVRIVVTNEGMFRLTSAQIASVLTSTSQVQVAQSILRTNFSLTCGGEAVAWHAESGGSALQFFGQGYHDTYADQNVYWLKPGPGLAMSRTNRSTDRVAVNPWFWETARAEINTAFMPYLPGEKTNDYWVWTGRSLTSPLSSWQWTTNIPLIDAHATVKSGQVTAYLAGGYNGTPALDNRTLIYAGDRLLNDHSWSGDIRLSQTGITGDLGGNPVSVTVEVLRRSDVTTTMVLIDAVEVRYARSLQALNNQLKFVPRGGTNTVTVREFTSSMIQVFDITNPLRPVIVTSTIVREGATWRASWTVDPAVPRRFLAVATVLLPERIDGVNDPGWTRRRTGAPHLVIAPKELKSAANSLVAYRRSQGLDSLLIPLEELYNDFSFGRTDPRAIPRFLDVALTTWRVKPAYVCLAGDGHLDYHDYYNQVLTRPNHVPPILDRLPYNAQSSGVLVSLGVDNPLADTDGDGVPNVAIGRLPAKTSAALITMIKRIQAHEADDSWKTKILLVSDKDEADAFGAARERLVQRVGPGMSVQRLGHAVSTPPETMRTNFIQTMNSGPWMAFYYGHANNVGISSPYFFEHSYLRSNMSSLTNSERAPVLIAGTCMLNNFAAPHPDNRCLGTGFLDTAPGGPVAVWASSSESTLAMAEALSGTIMDQLFATEKQRLGDLLKPAIDIQAQGASPWMVRNSVLMGDPGMRIQTKLFSPVCTLSPVQSLASHEARSGQTVSIQANIAWTAVADQPWITITSDKSGSGDGTITYSISPNSGTVRSGTIRFSGGGISRTFTVNQWPASTHPLVSAEGDFDGDFEADLATFQPVTGIWDLLFSGQSQWAIPFGSQSMLPVPADYDGDGLADVALFQPTTGNWYILYSSGGSRKIRFGWSKTVPVPSDYDGDGRTDLALYYPNQVRWYFLGTRVGGYSVQFGGKSDIPVPADYDGDGATDIAVYRPSNGTWYIIYSGGGFKVKQFGWATTIPVPGDYDSDGRADIAILNRPTSKWCVLLSGGGGEIVQFGYKTMTPVQADYDGDGATDMAMYHPVSGTWYIRESSTGTHRKVVHGGADRIPVLLYPLIYSWFGLF